MLDTDTSIYTIKKRPGSVKKHLGKLSMDQVCLSVITFAELLYGIEHSSNKKQNRASVDEFVRHLTVFDWDDRAAEHYGDIRHVLEVARTPIGSMDMMTAAHARSIDATLVTNNLKHFRRVKGLNIVNWVL
ncbi:MAG: type II toxin-antitoxin system tRNA(fMet)-specific endonuclease VapC [Acidiferrobacterales bacterium]